MKFNIELTWSKFMALVIFGGTMALDIINKSTQTVMFALPFIIFLLTGKQVIDWRKDSLPEKPKA